METALNGLITAAFGSLCVILIGLLISLMRTHGTALKQQGETLVELMTVLCGAERGAPGLAANHEELARRVHKLSNRQHALRGRHSLLAQRVHRLDGEHEPTRREDDHDDPSEG